MEKPIPAYEHEALGPGTCIVCSNGKAVVGDVR